MFYSYHQNNSGGSFHVDEDVAEFVIIEADNSASADSKAEMIGIYFNGVEDDRDCDCCGDRWYGWSDEESEPMLYGKPIAESGYKDCIIVHYADGTKRKF